MRENEVIYKNVSLENVKMYGLKKIETNIKIKIHVRGGPIKSKQGRFLNVFIYCLGEIEFGHFNEGGCNYTLVVALRF